MHPCKMPSQAPPHQLATTWGCTKLVLPFHPKPALLSSGQSCSQGAEGLDRAFVHSLQDPGPTGRCHQRLVVKPPLGPDSYLNASPTCVLWN